jgi:hypothetical protein
MVSCEHHARDPSESPLLFHPDSWQPAVETSDFMFSNSVARVSDDKTESDEYGYFYNSSWYGANIDKQAQQTSSFSNTDQSSGFQRKDSCTLQRQPAVQSTFDNRNGGQSLDTMPSFIDTPSACATKTHKNFAGTFHRENKTTRRPHSNFSASRTDAMRCCCQNDVCGARLEGEKAYYQRYHLCKQCIGLPELVIEGDAKRFCQQCSLLHPIGEFDAGKKSCRTKLAMHALRLRRRRAAARLIQQQLTAK